MRKLPYPVLALLLLTLATTSCGLGALARPGTPTAPTSTVSSAEVATTPLEASATSAPPADRDPAYAAQRFLLTWARPAVPYGIWWTAVAPLMNPEGRQDYATTDPANLPMLTLTGPPTVQPSAVPTSVTVWQTTSRGRFGVRLTRTSPNGSWLVAALTFPPGLH